MMKLHFHTAEQAYLGSLEIEETASVDELKDLFYAQYHYYPERQKLTLKGVKGPLLTSGSLKENGVDKETTIYFKDLGVQISWRLVFFLEYLGPILIYPLFFASPEAVYGVRSTLASKLPSSAFTRNIALLLFLGHFVKREFETIFIHRFSKATMPIKRLPINCLHYWLICGLSIGYFMGRPEYRAPWQSKIVILTLALLMVGAEYMNFKCHVVLRQLRPRGTKERGIPCGYGFDYLSCANYFWESLSWLLFSVLTNTYASWIFTIIAMGQMTQWALQKHNKYRKDFKEYPRQRRAIIPFLL